MAPFEMTERVVVGFPANTQMPVTIYETHETIRVPSFRRKEKSLHPKTVSKQATCFMKHNPSDNAEISLYAATVSFSETTHGSVRNDGACCCRM